MFKSKKIAKIGAGVLITKDVLLGVVAVSKNEQIILS